VTPEEEAYVRYRLERARRALDEAKVLVEAGLLPAAVSRIYYAGFYSVTALLLTRGQRRSKHTGVIALFNKDWVRTGLLPAELGRRFRHMLDHRLDADYKDMVTFAPDEVGKWLREAEAFVAQVSALVEQQVRPNARS
jgi:hypothetical protein